MVSLEELNVSLGGISLESKTNIVLIMESGVERFVNTPLSISDFTKLWESHKKIIKLPTGKADGYVCIKKKHVDFLLLRPLN